MSRMEDFKLEKSSMGQIFASDSLQIEGEVGGSAPVARGGMTAGGGGAKQKNNRDSGLAHDSDGEFEDDLDPALDNSRGRDGGVPRGVSKEQVSTQQPPVIDSQPQVLLLMLSLGLNEPRSLNSTRLHTN